MKLFFFELTAVKLFTGNFRTDDGGRYGDRDSHRYDGQPRGRDDRFRDPPNRRRRSRTPDRGPRGPRNDGGGRGYGDAGGGAGPGGEAEINNPVNLLLNLSQMLS